MAVEADLKLQVGKKVAQRFPHENPWSAPFAAKLLAESGLKEAIAPLTDLLAYQTSWDHKHCQDSVHHLALATLRKFVADKDEFRHEAACQALSLLAGQSVDFYRNIVKTWAIELLVGLTYHNCTYREWAREQLKELVGNQVV